MKTINEIVTAATEAPLTEQDVALLIGDLVAREDELADTLRLAAVQFGLYPQIVAKVFADVGVGTPPSEEGKALINSQYVQLMMELQQAQQEGGQ